MAGKKVIIIGASSGIGYELAKVFSAKGHEVGITARRLENLQELQKGLSGKSYLKRMDVSHFEEARKDLDDLIHEMGGVDIIVINAGIGDSKPTWQKEIDIIMTNAAGFTALGNFAYDYFVKKGTGGQIVGVSSLASLRGTRIATVYSATKAYVSSYMEGLQHHARSKNNHITITDIRPGFVATPMTEQNKNMFWVAPAEKAAIQTYDAIMAKKRIAYITKRWALVAFIAKRLPDFLFYRL